MTTVHHIGRTDVTTCDMTLAESKANQHQESVLARDVTCSACLRKIAELRERGFVPRY